MVRGERVFRERRDHRLADAIVVRLDVVGAAAGARPHEAASAEQLDERRVVGRKTGRGAGDARVQRSARDRNHVEQAARLVGQLRDARADQVLDRHLAGTGRGRDRRVTRQRVDEERTAAGFARDGLDARRRGFAAAEQRRRELAHVGGLQLADFHLAQRSRRMPALHRGDERVQHGVAVPRRCGRPR